MTTEPLNTTPRRHFHEGYCLVEEWKKVKKIFRSRCYEVLNPRKVGDHMYFSYIHRLHYINLLTEIFTQAEE